MASKLITPFAVPPLTAEEEEELIVTRLANDEKVLRRLTKHLHSITSLAQATRSGTVAAATTTGESEAGPSKQPEEQLHDARELFLADLDIFQMMLIKNKQVCDAETRMISHYEKEKLRVAAEHQTLLQTISQLKIDLAEAQMTRKRRMEYDEIAAQINMYSSRADLETIIARHEEEVQVAKAERQKLEVEMLSRKLEFDLVVSALQGMRARGLGKDDSRSSEGAEPGEIEGESQAETNPTRTTTPTLNPSARPFQPGPSTAHLLNGAISSRPGTPSSSFQLLSQTNGNHGATLRPPGATRSTISSPRPATPRVDAGPADDDIEMGEVAEVTVNSTQPPPAKGKRVPKEELEEGEASDQSSDLSDLPEEYQS